VVKHEKDAQARPDRGRPASKKPPLGRRPREAGGGPQTRAAILDAGMELFAERGFDGTPVKKIAKAAGVATGLIFHYFGNKEGLLRALIDERTALPLLGGTIAEIASRDPRPEADALLTEVGRSVYLMARHSAPMLRVMVREILQREQVREHWDDARQRAFTVFGQTLSEAASPSIEPEHARALARTFLDTVLFEALFGPDVDADALMASIVRTVNLPGRGRPAADSGAQRGS